MQSLVLHLVSELNNLENELTVLLQLQPPNNTEENIETSKVLEESISKMKTRLTTIIITFTKLLEENKNSNPVELSTGSALSGEEVVISAMSALLLNFFLRISLKFNCNISSSSVLLNRLSQDTPDGSSVQTMFINLLDKVIDLDE